MTRTGILTVSTVLSLFSSLLLPSVTKAAVVNVGPINSGPIFFIDPNSPEFTAGFQVGEDVILSFTFDDTTVDNESNLIGEADYEDPNGVITLTGAVSGASIDYLGGIELQFDDSGEFEIDTFQDEPDSNISPILDGDIDFNISGPGLFTDVDNLALTLSEINAGALRNESSDTAYTEYFNGVESVRGMEFGPTTPVPEPLTILGAGTAIAFGTGFKRKSDKAKKKSKNNV